MALSDVLRAGLSSAFPPILAAFGRESTDGAALRKHHEQDRGTAVASGIGEHAHRNIFLERGKQGKETVAELSATRAADSASHLNPRQGEHF